MPTPEQPRKFELSPLSKDLQKVVDGSKAVAIEYGSAFVEPPHIFLTMLRLQKNQAIQPIAQLGEHVNLDAMIKSTQALIPQGPFIEGLKREIVLSGRSQTAIIYAYVEAENHGQDEIKTEDMLTGIMRGEQGIVTTMLGMFGYI